MLKKTLFTPLTVMCVHVWNKCILSASPALNRLSQNTVQGKLSLSSYIWTSLYSRGFWASPSGSKHKIVGPFSPHVLISCINTPLISGSLVGTLNHTLYRSLSCLKREREREQNLGFWYMGSELFLRVTSGLVTGAQPACGSLWPCGPGQHCLALPT